MHGDGAARAAGGVAVDEVRPARVDEAVDAFGFDEIHRRGQADAEGVLDDVVHVCEDVADGAAAAEVPPDAPVLRDVGPAVAAGGQSAEPLIPVEGGGNGFGGGMVW